MAIKNSGAVNLPTTTLGVTIVPILWDAPDNLITHGTNFGNWTVDAGSSKVSSGIKLVQNAGSDFASITVSGLQSGTNYWCSMVLSGGNATGNVRVVAAGQNIYSTSSGDFDISTPTVGYYKYFPLRTDGTTGGKLRLENNNSASGTYFLIGDFRIYSGAARSAAKVAVLGDREGGYIAAAASGVSLALISPLSDTLNILTVGDQASATETYQVCNGTNTASGHLLADIRGKGGNIYPMMGNHDYDATRETDWFGYYDHVSGLNSGQRYYNVKLGWMDIFVLNDNGPDDNVGGPAPENNSGGREAASAAAFQASIQGQWLQSGLAASTGKWKVVMIHHPPYTSSATGPFPSCRLPFATWGAHLVLQSHDHGIERMMNNGIYHYTIAMGGGNHHGWSATSAASPAVSQFRVDANITANFSNTYGYLKLSDSPNALVLEYFDTGHQMLDRARLSQV